MNLCSCGALPATCLALAAPPLLPPPPSRLPLLLLFDTLTIGEGHQRRKASWQKGAAAAGCCRLSPPLCVGAQHSVALEALHSPRGVIVAQSGCLYLKEVVCDWCCRAGKSFAGHRALVEVLSDLKKNLVCMGAMPTYLL